MSTVILKTEVQARIDALSYPIDATELLQNAVDTVGLGLDLTNIIAVHTSATNAITGATSGDDITALNAASIALGITSNSGSGGGYPIGSVVPLSINGTPLKYTDELGNKWLRTGALDTDIGLYPNLVPSMYEAKFDYPNPSVEITPQVTASMLIYLNGEIWIGTTSSTSPAIYSTEGKFIRQVSSIGNEGNNLQDIATSGAEVFILRSSSYRRVDIYDTDGVFLRSFSTASQETTPTGILYKDGYIYVAGTAEYLYEYELDGTYTGNSYSVKAQMDTPATLCVVDDMVYIAPNNSSVMYRYDSTFTYIDSVSAGATIYGISYDSVNEIMYSVRATSYLRVTDKDFGAVGAFISTETLGGLAKGICSDGTFIYAPIGLTQVEKYDLSGTFVESIPLSTPLSVALYDIAYLDGHLYTIDTYGSRGNINKYDMLGNFIGRMSDSTTYRYYYGITALNGYLYIVDALHDVYKVEFGVSKEWFSSANNGQMFIYKGKLAFLGGNKITLMTSDGSTLSIEGELVTADSNTVTYGGEYVDGSLYTVNGSRDIYVTRDITDVVGEESISYTGNHVNYIKVT